jgi:hypothetical protein
MEALWLFCRSPCPSNQSFDIIAKSCTSVVQTKKRISSDLFKLALTDNAAPPALVGFVDRVRKMPFNIFWIMRIFI